MNFGSLRVGNVGFVNEFNRCVANSWRIENEGDMFAWVPRSLGYLHVGNGVRLFSNGKLCFLDDGSIDGGALWSPEVSSSHRLCFRLVIATLWEMNRNPLVVSPTNPVLLGRFDDVASIVP
jgi:hypothetical protein